MEKPDIIFDAERMKNPHTGIYHYCQQLGSALLQQQRHHQHRIGFYLPPNVQHSFKNTAPIIRQLPLHKLSMRFAAGFKLWHCTNQSTSYFPFKSKGKILLTIHDLNFLYEKQDAQKRKKYLDLLQQKADRADAIVAISQFVKKEIQQHLQVQKKNVHVIYNGCNIRENIIPIKPAIELKAPFIFSIGTIAHKKNFHVLPGALLHNQLQLVIAGVVHSKEYLQKIFDEAKRIGVADRVHFIGPVTEEEKYWLLQHCILFAFPSLAEGFGLPVIEAMRFGKPVLLSQATSLPEVGGELATYLQNFDADHVSAMANEAITFHSDAKSEQLINRSNEFSWDNAAEEYWKVYEGVLR
ncbi:glycosyltransferase family 4 protein [Aridibaculum aurantiacum]|uniref:glycosyltransferase family 4 protein n=1 Tax=Aridibaculum aurantiacum TaxID=2810307 RepID=UPI001A9622CB|nr:glycosyltransferase family 1 protein [Aridibaculum aurantiacum]